MIACTPGSAPIRPAGEPSAAADLNATRTLVYAIEREPQYISLRGLETTAPGATGPSLFAAGLTRSGGQGRPTELGQAEAFPQLGSDTWKVLPDGTMETTWRLRPNLTWHDGAPLTAEDFVFGFQVYRLPEFDGRRFAGGQIANVSAADARTVVIQWKTSYALAAEEAVPALPRHILSLAFETLDSESFKGLPYWTTEFVGTGPYALERWEPGAFIQGRAFPGYVFGKPRIERIKVVFIPDGNTLVANMLSGEVHWAAPEFEQAIVLRNQWAATGEGAISLNPTKIRYVQVQYKSEYTSPSAILDLRVRQALSHAIDREAMADTMLDGERGAADTFLAPTAPYSREVDRVISKYPLDPRRTEQLMADAGFTRDGEGFFGQGGSRFRPQLAAFAGQGQREALILQDSWKRTGVDSALRVITQSERADLELISTYPAFRVEQTNADQPGVHWSMAGCAQAERLWVGSNRGCYSNPEYQRAYDGYLTILDPAERVRSHVQAMKILSDTVAGMPLYYGYLTNTYTAQLAGLSDFGHTNIHEWHWKR